MFELPEIKTLARQINQVLSGKVVQDGRLGNRLHKFVWYNQTHADFARLTKGKRVGPATSRGKWLFVPLEPGYVLLVGECGGRLLYHPEGEQPPAKFHLRLTFEDGTALSATTQMWGAFELYPQGEEQDRQYIKGMRITPDDPAFTLAYFQRLVDEVLSSGKRSAKGLLTQDQLLPGLGNAIAQDILFRARLHPQTDLAGLSSEQRRGLYDAIRETVAEVTKRGGRHDEVDLFGEPGGYVRVMDASALKRPCPACGGTVQKIQYLGGVCYLCPRCQEDQVGENAHAV
jgi:formamidopyrimidine-DNA glycosylase